MQFFTLKKVLFYCCKTLNLESFSKHCKTITDAEVQDEHTTADVAAHLALCSTFSFPQGQSHHLKSMEQHRILKEVNTFIAVTETVTSENILIFIFNPL